MQLDGGYSGKVIVHQMSKSLHLAGVISNMTILFVYRDFSSRQHLRSVCANQPDYMGRHDDSQRYQDGARSGLTCGVRESIYAAVEQCAVSHLFLPLNHNADRKAMIIISDK